MRKAALLTLLTFALAVPLTAQEDRERHQSYVSFDDGGSMIKSGEDGREIEARRNLPVYPGDEVITARRGRVEVRLSDGNIIGLDRATALLFRSILDSYEGDGNETVAELKYGKAGVHRTDIGRDHVRLDTQHASYVAQEPALYSVESDGQGRDRVTVFDGSVEVRTRTRSTRMRAGETASVDDRGVYDLVGDQRSAADDFEGWLLKRAEAFGSYAGRHMDREQAYWNDDLDDHGQWVFVSGVGYSWRPYVAVGWRPYYNGYWYTRAGSPTWVSYDPWGWGTYHYGRWAFDPVYGWVWVPGYGYAPAWVYWWYGSGYVGWAPSGYWDCHRSNYGWAYNPYRHRGHDPHGYGFYGRVKVSDVDLRPWTFVDSRGGLGSNRIDRAALTAGAVKERLARSRDGFATVSGGTQRFTRDEWKDPAETVRRRSIERGQTGRETGAPPMDMTPYFRRDGDVSGTVRDRIVRAARGDSGTGSGSGSGRTVGTGTGSGTPITTGVPSRTIGGGSSSVAPITGGGVAPIGRGSVAPVSGRSYGDSGNGVTRGTAPPSTPSTPPDSGTSSGSGGRGIDRGRETGGGGDDDAAAPVSRGRDRTEPPAVTPPSSSGDRDTSTPSNSGRSSRSESWRNRVRNDAPSSQPSSGGSSSSTSGNSSSTGTTTGGSSSTTGSSDAPSRRVIDRIGGPRISRESGSSSDRGTTTRSDGGSSTRPSSSGGSSKSSSGGSSTRQSDSGRSSGSSARDSGSKSSSSGSSTRDSSSKSSSGSSTRDSSSKSSSDSKSSSSSSGKSDSGSTGRVKRD